jgi:hypothetical protein
MGTINSVLFLAKHTTSEVHKFTKVIVLNIAITFYQDKEILLNYTAIL